ncbi:MAG: chitobiase/beta-hexosaminidase C-terminal domain-containing protein [Lachnospiraceae bacterium]|nr:chitobiase/beta-hexosaminidase C-terminal domain-containing protein [Lachnospiraceae bacterium]
MVPDYEVELDALIDGGVSDVANIVDSPDENEKAETAATHVENPISREALRVATKTLEKDVDKHREETETPVKKTDKKTKIILVGIGVFSVIFIALIFIAIINFNRYFSVEYQYSEALKYYNIGNYADSLKVAKHALDLDKNDRRIKLLLADDYNQLEKYDESNAILYSLLEQNTEDTEIYERILDNCIATDNYTEIDTLAKLSPTEEIKSIFSPYMADPPQFSDPGGEYEDDLSIWLTANTPGTIYYTVDGSEPTEKSIIYKEPIELTEGETTISALLVNDYGIKSASVTNTYTIEYGFTAAPVLIQKSGTYNIPEPVEVQYPDDCTLYYTDNGEDPTTESLVYERPILLPMGKSEYRFMCVDDKDRVSDVVVATYNVEMNCIIDRETAVNAIKFQLISRGENVFDMSYKVRAAYGQNGSSYYVIYEYSPNDRRTGRMFAVDTKLGSLFSLTYNGETGKYVLTSI